MSEQSISDQLAALGIRHERTPDSVNTGEHILYRGAECLGHFTAYRAVQTFLTTDGENNADDDPMRSSRD